MSAGGDPVRVPRGSFGGSPGSGPGDGPGGGPGDSPGGSPGSAPGHALGRHLALIVWALLALTAAVIAARAHYTADLSAFLPSKPTAEQAVLLDQLRSGAASRAVLIGIEGGTPTQRRAASTGLAAALRTSGAFDAVHNGDRTGLADTGRFIFAHRYLLSPAVDARHFSIAGLREAIDDTVSQLGSPTGALIEPVIGRDPTGESLRLAEMLLPTNAPRSDGRVWISRNAARAVLIATTHAAGADLDGQQQALQTVHTDFAPFAAEGLRLRVSGAGSFAVEARSRIKADVERLAIAGGVAVAGGLLLAFGGSVRTLATAALPVISGVLAGIAAVSLAFGNVHGVTLGFGTTLLGEAVDYAIYYLIQARPAPGQAAGSGARHWLIGNWPTVRLGLWTSVCGFAALLFSGFPGLAQLGVFSIAGLTAAGLTTRTVLTAVSPDGAPGMGLRRPLGRATGACFAVLPRWRWPLGLVALGAIVVLAVRPSPWHGDLASLSPVGALQLKLDAELRADLGASDAGTLVAVSASDEEAALVGAEAAASRLDRLVDDGVIAGYESPTRFLPSRATQTRRLNALPDAETLQARLAEATAGGALPAARLGTFVTDVQAARVQPLLTRESLAGTPLQSAVDALLLPGSLGDTGNMSNTGHTGDAGQAGQAEQAGQAGQAGQAKHAGRSGGASPSSHPDDADHPGNEHTSSQAARPWRALLSLQPGARPIDTARLRAALAGLPGTRVVAIGPELAALYARYLHEAVLQALLGAVAVCMLLALHLRSLRRLWRIARPVSAAVLVVLAGFCLAGPALGILHLVGFLLTVAIGSNYALFFDQIRHRQDNAPPGASTAIDPETLASLALANLTAVISFGLLASSSIPALYAVGQVVGPGILLAMVFSAAFIPARGG